MALSLGLAGCISADFASQADDAWLVDGKTTRAEALAHFGEPAQYYQGGYILAYRYSADHGFAQQDGDARGRASVGSSVTNLILVFGADRVLLRHSRVVLK